jgi:hypothetical protein
VRELGGAGSVAVVTLICCTSWTSDAKAADIAVREIEANSYEVTLTNPTSLGEREAQVQVANVAISVCKGLQPVLGKYRFESKEALEKSVLSRDSPSYLFVQNFTCTSAPMGAVAQRAPTLKSAKDAERVREDIKRRSEEYFRLLAADRVDDVYPQILAAALGSDKTAWVRNQRSFRSLAGNLQSVSIVRITIYDNPAEAPEPGLYVAADFNNEYQNVPFQCGYLVWYRAAGGDFGITRVDTGHVTAEQLKTIPAVQLPELKRKLRCVAP